MKDNKNKLIELVEDGNLDPVMELLMYAIWMSDNECVEMLDANELSERFNQHSEG